MEEVKKKLIDKFSSYINSFEISETKKNKYIRIFKMFINSRKNDCNNINSSFETSKTYLLLSYNFFIKQLDNIINSNNIEEVILFIKNNPYNFNIGFLNYEQKKLYNILKSDNFDAEEFILLNRNYNFELFIHNMHSIAHKMGYIEKHDLIASNNYIDNDIPISLKDAIKGVEK